MFSAFERTFKTSERTFNTSERTFNTSERRFLLIVYTSVRDNNLSLKAL